jgi:hypothetical protein
MTVEQLNKANELQKCIFESRLTLDKYKNLGEAKIISIYNTSTNDNSVYIKGELQEIIIKALVGYEQFKVDGYLLEFEKL